MTYKIMKMQFTHSVGIKAKLEYLVDIVTEILLDLKDFDITQKIRFGEFFYFGFVFFRAAWYVTFGVETSFDYYFSDKTWMLIFVAASVVHIGCFFLPTSKPRSLVVLFYGFIWGFLTFLAVIAHVRTAAIPTYGFFALCSGVIAAMIWNQDKRRPHKTSAAEKL